MKKQILFLLPFCIVVTGQLFCQTWQNPSTSQSYLYFNVDGGDPSIKYDIASGFTINAKFQEAINFTDGGDGNSNFYIDGNVNRVGIGTTNPDSKLTVLGHVNVGGDSNFSLKTRHVIGKAANSTSTDDLYLNYDTGKHVRIGFGPNNPFSNLYVGGNIGAGTGSPSSRLHVVTDASGGSPHSLSDLTVEDSGDGMILLLTPSNKTSYFGFADTDDNYVGGIQYEHTADRMVFRVNDHQVGDMVIDNTGRIGIGTIAPERKLHVEAGDVVITNVNQSRLLLRGDGSNDYSGAILEMKAPGVSVGNHFASFIQHTRTPTGEGSFYMQRRGAANQYYGNLLIYKDGEGWQFNGSDNPSNTTTANLLKIDTNGNVGIGTTTPNAKLAVNGSIHAQEVKVDLVGWPDYVFQAGYDLPSLEEVEQHIREKGHLINMPSAKEVEENGVQLGEMNKLLLKKIEELTLYILQQEQRIQQLEQQNKKW